MSSSANVPARRKVIGKLPEPLFLDLLPKDLEKLEAELEAKGKSSSVSGWFCLTCGVGDALLLAYRQPTLSVWGVKAARDGLISIPASAAVLALFDRLAPVAVILAQFGLLALGASILRKSPWGAWMGRALRATSLWTCSHTLVSTALGSDLRWAVSKISIMVKERFSSLGTRLSEMGSVLRPAGTALLMLLSQLYIWAFFWYSSVSLHQSLPDNPRIPRWLPVSVFWIATFLMAWLLVTMLSNILRDSSAILGIAFGIASLIVGLIYGQSGADALFGQGDEALFEGIRWWAVGFVSLWLIVVSTLSLDTWDTGQVRMVNIRSPQWLHVSIPNLQWSTLPPLRFRLAAPEQSIVVLQQNESGDYRIKDPSDIIMPTRAGYDFINLSALGKQKDLSIDVDLPDKSYRMKLQFVARTVPPDTLHTPSALRGIVLAGPAVRRIIHAFFRMGEGQVAELRPVMTEVVKTWLGRYLMRASELSARCDNVVRSASLGISLPKDSPVGGVAGALMSKIRASRGVVDIAKDTTLAKLDVVHPLQMELMLIEEELLQYEQHLISARATLQEKFQKLIVEAIEKHYPASHREHYRSTLAELLKFIGLELVAVSHTEMERVVELRGKIVKAKQKLISENMLDTSLVKAFQERDATLLNFIRLAIQGQVEPEVFVQSMTVLSGGGGPANLNSEGQDKKSLPNKHEPPM